MIAILPLGLFLIAARDTYRERCFYSIADAKRCVFMVFMGWRQPSTFWVCQHWRGGSSVSSLDAR
jgi:hypothetical protein